MNPTIHTVGNLYFRGIGMLAIILVIGCAVPFLLQLTNPLVTISGFVLLVFVGVPVLYFLTKRMIRDVKKLITTIPDK